MNKPLCKFFLENKCVKGNICKFAHQENKNRRNKKRTNKRN